MRSRLRAEGWIGGLLMVAPLLLVDRLPHHDAGYGLVFFLLGLGVLFLSLPRFTEYKHALIDMERALGQAREAEAWARLASVRRRALLVAALPAWLGAVGALFGLEPIASYLLVAASLVLLLLYRLPRQLG
ncbi:hypothetical protein HW090_06125 [Pseudomonas sp. ABC1]|uniref:hypothetical protein n=1 Tax=Pseudomonas sp. ABC1 TaxID=2748080 RepID=UPI0015C3CBA6|nr:hypothetical protein [Pseudomonas sp. ABC1]QLF92790.1 hypothetical protein HW090_06125 [Pseudomonas sp. ABC1]